MSLMKENENDLFSSLPNRVYLVGFMGCGKSTAGKRLAKRLGYRFIDLDKQIEAQYKTSIPQLFEQYDEHAFRLLEQKALQQTYSTEKTVIATGGGTPCFFDNMDFMLNSGLVIYIHIPPKGLSDRLKHTKKKRPLISQVGAEELTRHISEKLDERKDYYEKAHLKVEGIDLTVTGLEKAIFNYALR